jgi:hypothetical protein
MHFVFTCFFHSHDAIPAIKSCVVTNCRYIVHYCSYVTLSCNEVKCGAVHYNFEPVFSYMLQHDEGIVTCCVRVRERYT